MGVFFFTHSVALAEDLTLQANYTNLDEFYKDVNASYEQVIILPIILGFFDMTLFFL